MVKKNYEAIKNFEAVQTVLDSDLVKKTMGLLYKANGLGRIPIDSALADLSDDIGRLINADDLREFWNRRPDQIEEAFTYNPTLRYPELSEPDEDRIDATNFSVVLAAVATKDDDLTLYCDRSRPLVDNLGSYFPRGRLVISGETGDGTAHHAGPDSWVIVKSPTGDNLGFSSAPGANIYAGSAVGSGFSENVTGPIAHLTHLREQNS